MTRKALPKAQAAILAEHEAGKHDVYNGGYPTKGPQPETCRDCAKRMQDEEAVVLAGGPAPIIPKVRKAKPNALTSDIEVIARPPRVRIVKAPPEFGPIDKVAEYKATLPPAGMGFSTDVTREREPLTREEWLLQALSTMRGWFPEDHQVPDVRVSIGWPAGRGSSRFIGQCFYTVADHQPALFVAPSLADVADILETLLHEAVHAAAGVGVGHKGLFVSIARGLGFVGPWRSTPASPELKATLADLATNLGAFPHSKVLKSDATRPSVQGTRMLLLTCSMCGYIVRTTRKWIDIGLPSCPDGDTLEEAV